MWLHVKKHRHIGTRLRVHRKHFKRLGRLHHRFRHPGFGATIRKRMPSRAKTTTGPPPTKAPPPPPGKPAPVKTGRATHRKPSTPKPKTKGKAGKAGKTHRQGRATHRRK